MMTLLVSGGLRAVLLPTIVRREWRRQLGKDSALSSLEWRGSVKLTPFDFHTSKWGGLNRPPDCNLGLSSPLSYTETTRKGINGLIYEEAGR